MTTMCYLNSGTVSEWAIELRRLEAMEKLVNKPNSFWSLSDIDELIERIEFAREILL